MFDPWELTRRTWSVFLAFGLLFLLLYRSQAAMAQQSDFANAEDLFKRDLYAEALKVWDRLQGNGQGWNSQRLHALWRAAQCEARLGRLEAALTRVESVKGLSDSSAVQLDVLRWELIETVASRYGDHLDVPPTEDGKGQGLKSKTRDQLIDDLNKISTRLIQKKDVLAAIKVAPKDPLVETQNVDLDAYPTWLDLFALKVVQHPALDVKRGTAGTGDEARAWIQVAIDQSAAGRETARDFWTIEQVIRSSSSGKGSRSADGKQASLNLAESLQSIIGRMKTPRGQARVRYQAALFLNQGESFKLAVDLCTKAAELAPKSPEAALCQRLSAGIRTPYIELSGHQTSPSGERAADIAVRNLSNLHLRLIEVSPSELPRDENLNGGWTYLSQEQIKKFLQKKAIKQWETETKPRQPHEIVKRSLSIDMNREGLYLLVASSSKNFDIQQSIVKGALVNVSKIVLLGGGGMGVDPNLLFANEPPSSWSIEPFHFFVVSASNGQPVRDAQLEIVSGDGQTHWTSKLATNEQGHAKLSYKLSTSTQHQYVSTNPLARHEGSLAYWQRAAGASFSKPAPLRIFADLERTLFRPGQTLKGRATLLVPDAQGYHVAPQGLKISARGIAPNGKEFFAKDYETDSNGVVAFDTKVPLSGMLGRHNITFTTSFKKQDISEAISFDVEEYRRPDFAVTIDPGKTLWRFGKEGEMKGHVSYLSGGAVAGAQLRYTVSRQSFWPFFLGDFRPHRSFSGPSVVARGQVSSNDKGEFAFTFTPNREDLGDSSTEDEREFARYHVLLEVQGQGSGVGNGEASFAVGTSPYVISAEGLKVLSLGETVPSFKAEIRTLGGETVSGSLQFEIARVDLSNQKFESSDSNSYRENHNWEELVRKAPLVASTKQILSRSDSQVNFPSNLPSGVYRISAHGKIDANVVSENWHFVHVAKDEDSRTLKLPGLSLASSESVDAGSEWVALIGNGLHDSPLFVQTWIEGRLTNSEILSNGRIQVVRRATKEWAGRSVTFRWFTIRDYKVTSNSVGLQVVNPDRKLKLAIGDLPPVAKPGDDLNVSIQASNATGKSVGDGSALFVVRDQSLSLLGNTPTGLWTQDLRSIGATYLEWMNTSIFDLPGTETTLSKGEIAQLRADAQKYIPEPALPSLLGLQNYRSYRKKGSFGGLSLDSAPAAPMMAEAVRADSSEVAREGRAPVATKSSSTSSPGQSSSTPRSNFAETAAFIPNISIKDGKWSGSVKLPEQLTAWDVESFVVTKDGRVARATAEFKAQKEIAARIQAPRFVREGDRIALAAIVQNLTSKSDTCSITISLKRQDRRGDWQDVLPNAENDMVCPGNGSVMHSHWLTAPGDTDSLKITASTSMGNFRDAETVTIPVLPSKQRLIVSSFVALRGPSNTKIENPVPRDFRSNTEALVASVEPQLLSHLLSAMPEFQLSPFESADSLAQKFVAITVLQNLYKRNPTLQTLAEKSGSTPSTATRDPELKQIDDEEQPWFSWLTPSKESSARLISAGQLPGRRDLVWSKLLELQLPSGGFAWFSGGKEDLYMSLLVAESWIEATQLGAEVPKDSQDKLLQFIRDRLTKMKEKDEQDLAIVALGSYILSTSQDREAITLVKRWLEHSRQNSRLFTPLGHSYLALAAHNIKDGKRATEFLKLTLDSLQHDKLTGAFWQAERFAWRWYGDSLFKHTRILLSLQTLQPDHPEIPGLVQWMLLNRKMTQWRSARTSTVAMAVLVKELDRNKVAETAETLKVTHGQESSQVVVSSDDLQPRLSLKVAGEQALSSNEPFLFSKNGPSTAFGSVSGVYRAELPDSETTPTKTLVQIVRRIQRLDPRSGKFSLLPQGSSVTKGDHLRVLLSLKSRTNLEYVMIRDPRPAGCEPKTTHSGWNWGQVPYISQLRDSATTFHLPRVPQGEVTLTYEYVVTSAGEFHSGPAIASSLLSSDVTHHTGGMSLNVQERRFSSSK